MINSNPDYCSLTVITVSRAEGVTNLPHYKNSRPENLGGRGEKIGVFIAETIFALPGGFIFRMIRPLNFEKLDGLVRSPVKNSLDTFWGNGNAILGDHMSKVGYFRKPEFTLGILSIEFVFSKLRQYKSKMFSMLFFILGVY